MIGQTLSHFKITAKLGEGGMGEVYLGDDTKLGRQVAIKVLPEAFTEDPERLARFEREAKVLASLSHTNIAGIHQVEQIEGKHFLVMELAEGETLAERIARGPVPVDEAVALALQMTEGLEAAHLRGIVHRDLKPANVKVTPDRQIKILDFGLARAMTSDPAASGPSAVMSQSPTLAAHMTGAGMIMGTAAYMAPEQARGETVDARADVWAFGVVLMEMLTGKSVWAASTVSDTLAAVLAREPNWDDLDPETPRAIRHLLERCLQKEARSRMQAIGEARLALDAFVADPEDDQTVAALTPSHSAPPWKRALPWMVAGGALLAAVIAFIRPEPAERQLPIRRHVVAQTDGEFSLSPDGSRIIYTDGDQLMIRELDQLAPRTAPDLEGALQAFWAPDGSEFAFSKDSKLWRANSRTLSATVIADFDEGFSYLSGTWSSTGTIYLAKWRGGIYSLPASGGALREFLAPDEELVDFHDLDLLPDGAILANPHLTSDFSGVEIIRDGERKRVHEFEEGAGILSVIYSPTGHLLYTRRDRSRGVWAVPFSLQRQEATGEPTLLIRDGRHPRLGADGSMSYLAGAAPRQTQFVWVDRQGRLLEPVGEQVEGIYGPRLSPDATRIAYSRSELRGNGNDIYIFDLERSLEERLTSSKSQDSRPVWAPDGERIAFHRDEGPWEASANRIWLTKADGTGEPEPLISSMGTFTFTPDSSTLIFTNWDVRLKEDILQIRLDSGGLDPVPVVTGNAQIQGPRLSPDGGLLAYTSDEAGEDQIYLARYPGVEQKWQVSRNGGRFAQWSSDGTRLFFLQTSSEDSRWRLMEAKIGSGEDPSPGRPELLFAPQGDEFTLGRGYAVTPDSERFLVVREFGVEATDAVVIQNWRSAFPGFTAQE